MNLRPGLRHDTIDSVKVGMGQAKWSHMNRVNLAEVTDYTQVPALTEHTSRLESALKRMLETP